MFDLTFVRGPRSDETSEFSMTFHRECTLQEFIDYIVIHKPKEFGSITLMTYPEVYGSPRCDYYQGKIERNDFTVEELSLTIACGDASGGYGCMHYRLGVQQC